MYGSLLLMMYLFSVANERVGIAGGSGSGALLGIIALLENPSGTLRLFGEDIHSIQNHTEIYRSMQMMFPKIPWR